MTTDIQTVPTMKTGANGLQLQNWEDMHRFAEAVAQSPLVPKDFKTPGAVMVAMQMGLEVGLAPMQALQSIAVINGRPVIWGDAAKALVLASGLCEDFQEFFEGDRGDRSQFKAVCVVKRKGIATPMRAEFSILDAERAQLLNKQGPWTQYPRRMLQMRARSWALRDGFPDVLKGLSCGEEVSDYTPEDNVVPLAPQSGGASPTTGGKRPNAKTVAAKPAVVVENEAPVNFGDLSGDPDVLDELDNLNIAGELRQKFIDFARSGQVDKKQLIAAIGKAAQSGQSETEAEPEAVDPDVFF